MAYGADNDDTIEDAMVIWDEQLSFLPEQIILDAANWLCGADYPPGNAQLELRHMIHACKIQQKIIEQKIADSRPVEKVLRTDSQMRAAKEAIAEINKTFRR